MTDEEKREEAAARMEQLKLPEKVTADFRRGILHSCLPPDIFPVLEGETLERVRAFEREHRSVVYFVIEEQTNIGYLENFLFVSDYGEEWAEEKAELTAENGAGDALAYVYNKTFPTCSEMGIIGIAPTVSGGLRRTW